jgi:hypothetical protein
MEKSVKSTIRAPSPLESLASADRNCEFATIFS